MPYSNFSNQISLRNLTSKDVDAFMTWASDDEVTKSLMWESYKSKVDGKEFLENIVEKHLWFKAICLGDQIIGSITLDKGKGVQSCKAELGYVIAKSHWSKGFATKAIKEVLKSGFTDLGIIRIEAFVDPENLSSVKLLEKSGFECKGLLKSSIIHKGVVKDRLLFAYVQSI